ncbi:DUF6339 family protein [Stenotrophomonas maltophilia]|jgi:hypothetical protein|uniref:DUF6339 family protein n=1 Tax=Stenotrophomonas maltophilia TaxID=40324 RepID=UPI0021C72F97|nr:DUF6339 family protein [Stenotrophomonas maltophilia]MCU1065977.1 hypothetical protein [Stenotrophomonas maltophilia]MCU1075735.1 hypothetical protein [Stenotrophomonas maltophilia]MCU1140390.1 hypothetical protein [Stenotrophomonas maltophilia]
MNITMVSAEVVESLASAVSTSMDLYRQRGFSNESSAAGWNIEVPGVSWDDSIPIYLSPDDNEASEVENSYVVYSALSGMTPAIARDERIWVRLCHVELFDYAKKRWMTSAGLSEAAVSKHFFASGVVGSRDDNSIGRLWWNGHVASLAFPSDLRRGLSVLLKRANIRKQVIDRADSAFRVALIGPLLREIEGSAWISENDKAIATFMKHVNRRFGGIVLEDLPEGAVRDSIRQCLKDAELASAR